MIASNKIKILLVDDHAILRDPLAEILGKESDMVVVGCAASGNEAIEVASEVRPDVILMDIDMPGIICFDAVRAIRDNQPDVKVIFLTALVNDRYIDEALQLESSGFMSKTDSPDRLVAAVREVALHGGACFSPDVLSRIVVEAGDVRLRYKSKSRAAQLTRRELEVLRYVSRGLGKKEIAAVMNRSIKTVDHHTSSLMKKLDIHDRVALTRFAIREGLTEQ